jgi:hypothetical protein
LIEDGVKLGTDVIEGVVHIVLIVGYTLLLLPVAPP